MSELVEHGRSKYSDEDRRRAVVEYCVSGLMTKVSVVTGIPNTTLSQWKNKSSWWDDLVVSVRKEINDRILAQNMEIAQKAGERVLDSLENGDEKLVWDKDKSEHVIKRVMPSGKDSMVMSGISQDKARVEMGMPTSISGTVDSKERVNDLIQHFSEISRAYNRANSIPGEAEDVTDLALESATEIEANKDGE